MHNNNIIETAIKTIVLEVLKNEGVLPNQQKDKSISEGEYLDTFEVGKILRQSHKYICKLIRQGKINAKKIGKKWLIHRDELNCYLSKIK